MSVYPSLAPTSRYKHLAKSVGKGSDLKYQYESYTVVAGSTIRISYSVDLPQYLLAEVPSLYDLFFYPITTNLGIYSSYDGVYPASFLDDVNVTGQGFVDVLVSQAQFIQVQIYNASAGPLVRKNRDIRS